MLGVGCGDGTIQPPHLSKSALSVSATTCTFVSAVVDASAILAFFTLGRRRQYKHFVCAQNRDFDCNNFSCKYHFAYHQPCRNVP